MITANFLKNMIVPPYKKIALPKVVTAPEKILTPMSLIDSVALS